VDAGDIEQLKETVKNYPTAGIMLEIVQGEGGVIPLSGAYVNAVAALAKEQDIPLMIDEVQTGNGRTGALYAYMHYGVQPDIVSTAKGLGGGLPIGATLVSQKLASVLGPGDQGSTYGGNPVACAGALTVIERLDEAFLAQVQAKSDYIFSALADAEGVEGVTGKGLMIGIKTKKSAKEVVMACMEKGVLCLTAKDKVRLLPALNIPMAQLEKAVAIIREACK
jgi:acetylornithine/N-succinyldiaminopimelate aminotransferase